MKLHCRRIQVADSNRILLKTYSSESNDMAETVPEYITIDLIGDEHSVKGQDAIVHLGAQLFDQLPVTPDAPEDASENYTPPLHDDEYDVQAFGVKVKLKRNKTIPNPNCYDVFYGKNNVGYVRLPFHSKVWGCAVVVQGSGLYDKFRAASFQEGWSEFCRKLGKILGVEV